VETPANRPLLYALGHSEQELQRLSRQGQALGPFTDQLFEQAGISRGMRVLDVGCGSGDVAFLAADLVGPEGKVVGVDRERRAIDWANARANSRAITNVSFVEGDPAEMEFDQKFDAIVGRLVLMYYPDPVGALRKLTRHVRPEGLVVFQEMDMANARSLPRCPSVRALCDVDKTNPECERRSNTIGFAIIPGVYRGRSSGAFNADRCLGRWWSAVPGI